MPANEDLPGKLLVRLDSYLDSKGAERLDRLRHRQLGKSARNGYSLYRKGHLAHHRFYGDQSLFQNCIYVAMLKTLQEE